MHRCPKQGSLSRPDHYFIYLLRPSTKDNRFIICVQTSSSRLPNLSVFEFGRFHEAKAKQRYQAEFGLVGSPHRRRK